MGRNYSDFKGDKDPNIKNGLYAKGSPFAGIKNSWQNMKQRCTNPKHPKFHRYGGRGIRVCDDWLDIDVFYKWSVANGWEKGVSIDRIDNDGDYCPSTKTGYAASLLPKMCEVKK